MEIIVVLGIPALLFLTWSKRPRKTVPELAWAPSGAQVVDRPIVRRGPRSVVVSLGRAEARLALRSPAIAEGIALCALNLFLFYVVYADENVLPQWTQLAIFPIMAHPMAGVSLLASHRAVLRGRRDRAEELFEATPTAPETRALGHGLAGSVPALIGLIFWLALVLAAPRVSYGRLTPDLLVDGLTGVVLIVGGSWFGILLARLAPWAVAPILALVAIAFASTALGGIGDKVWSPLRQLSTWPRYPDFDLLFTSRPVVAHLAYITGLVVGCLVLAVAWHRRSRAILVTGALAASLAVAGGIVATRPMSSAEARRIAALVARPADHQVCMTSERVRACAYDDYAAVLDSWMPAAEGALRGVPSLPVRGRFVVSQRLQADKVGRLSPEVRRLLDPSPASRPLSRPADGVYRAGFEGGDSSDEAVRLAAGLWATGLPVTRREDAPCAIGGQARGVVALWIAYQDLPTTQAESHVRAQTVDPHESSGVHADFAAGQAWPVNGDVEAPVVWSAPDLEAARRLLSTGHQLRDVIWAHWDRFTDPSTTTDELMTILGLASVARAPEIPPGAVICS